MRPITQDNLAEFKPANIPYQDRVEITAQLIGVESPLEEKAYQGALHQWNRASAIGLTEAELEIIALLYDTAKHNSRFDSDLFIHPDHGGNTSEHPIFAGAAFDMFKQEAGYGPENFDPGSPETLAIAQLSQRIHGMLAIHDVGELVDISYGEQHAAGASRKEPDEEALVAPFQFKLASYALSIGQPDYYTDTMQVLKETATAAKREYFAQAKEGKITGDEFVTLFGKVIGEQIAAAEKELKGKVIAPEYQAASETLLGLFNSGEQGLGLAGRMFKLCDRYEGTAHYARYAGKAAKDHACAQPNPDAHHQMLNRLFGDRSGSASFTLANSPYIVDQLKFLQKTLVSAFKGLEDEPEETREIATNFVKAATAAMMRIHITLLQKAPPFLDFDATGDHEPAIDPQQDAETNFTARLDVQRRLRDTAMDKMRARGANIDAVEGVMDTKTVIAVMEKAATAIEKGAWQPDPNDPLPFPVGKNLPDTWRLTSKDLAASAKKYPLDAAQDFRHDRFRGEAVRL